MRYSLSGTLRVDVLDDVMSQFIDHLVEYGIDEVRWLSLYYTPYASGQKVQFHTSDGDVLEHIAVEPIARRLISHSRRTTPISHRPPKRASAEMQTHATSVSQIMSRWHLDLEQMAALLKSHSVRIARILELEMPRLLTRETERLSLLLEIDGLFESLGQALPIGEWLRSDTRMSEFRGAVVLDQLLNGNREAILRLRDALAAILDAYADSAEAPALTSEFDTILEARLRDE